MTTANTNILVAGVSQTFLQTTTYDIGPRNDPAKIAASVKILQEDLKTNFHHTTFVPVGLNPGDEANWEEFVSTLKSKKWDCVSLGGGVRTIPECGEYFTELVNLVVRECPGVRLVFPLLPEDVGPAVRRWVPEAK
ncbi:hypothetical protein PRZ48_000925 [Zasmidium cellare]|uniref:Uncharacterized protein n=1 Tax=Zasmidium cellare TaxID=395010 RepID=A0ABR0F186_ZASCE|nr:hypothetical protein PRZ48_000925 [Zasmidium cellare]